MNLHQNRLDTSDELLVERHGPGIRLVRPNNSRIVLNDSRYSMRQLLSLPVNLYFMNQDSAYQRLNAITAESCGFKSQADALGRSLRAVAKRDTAAAILQNDQQVLATKSMHISHEDYVRTDDQEIAAISIKFPWLDDHYNIIGILGCSLLVHSQDYNYMARAISLLIQSGLLANSPALMDTILPGLRCGNIYLDKGEADILYQLVRGKTAKQIAKVLGISHRTIEHRLEFIKSKTQCHSKSELIEKFFDFFA